MVSRKRFSLTFHGDSTLSETPAGPYNETCQTLAEVPPPRPVRMSFRGKGTAIIIPAVLLLLFALTSRDYFHPTAAWQKETFVSFFRLASVVAVALGLVQWRIYVRHKHLVSAGEVAIGRITENLGSARNGQWVRYEFSTGYGGRFSRLKISWRNLTVGMRVPIFYDRKNPKRQIVLFAAYYEVPLKTKSAGRGSATVAKPL